MQVMSKTNLDFFKHWKTKTLPETSHSLDVLLSFLVATESA